MQPVKWTAEGMVKGLKAECGSGRRGSPESEYSMTLCVREAQGACWCSDEGIRFHKAKTSKSRWYRGNKNFSSLVLKKTEGDFCYIEELIL